MLGPNQLLNIQTHSGLNALCLCPCPKDDENQGGSQFGSPSPGASRRERGVNPFLRVPPRRIRGDADLATEVALLDVIEADQPSISGLPEPYVLAPIDYQLASIYDSEQRLASQSSSNLCEVVPQLAPIRAEEALLALIALGIFDENDCC